MRKRPGSEKTARKLAMAGDSNTKERALASLQIVTVQEPAVGRVKRPT
jgi:hypothetical protein